VTYVLNIVCGAGIALFKIQLEHTVKRGRVIEA